MLSLLLALALSTTPTLAGEVTETTLPNGLKVILKENHAAPVVTWTVTYKVGSRNEGAGITGSAHLLEHMMFKGTRTLGKGQVAQILDRNGASSNASTGPDYTRYYETYSSDRLELGLLIEAARMRDALILDRERASEMSVVRNELERGESEPNRLIYQALMAAAYKSHPYHHPTIGWRSDVEGVSTRELKHFYDTYYQPGNAVAVLVGDFKTADALEMVEKHFGRFPKGAPAPTVHTVEEPQQGERRVVLRHRGETNLLQMGYHIPAASHADMAPLLVLDTIMSSGVTGRLYQALVETKIATSAWTDVGLNKDPGLFRAGASLEPGADHAAVEKSLIAQLEALKQTPVTTDELQKAKRQARASYIYDGEGTRGQAFALSSYAVLDRWQRFYDLLGEMEAVTPADIQRVARTYLTQDNRTVVWYQGTPDGPVPARTAARTNQAPKDDKPPAIHPPFPFERRDVPARRTTTPIRTVLPNGMVVLVLENPGSQTVSLDGYVRAGALEDPADEHGVASAVAALLDAGTARRSKLALAKDLEEASAGLSFSAGNATTGISGWCLAPDTELLFGALAEALKTPTFPAEELDKLKSRWLAGIRQAEDQPSTRGRRAFANAIYPPGHPFAVDEPATELAHVGKLKREDLQVFHRRYYGPDHTVLVVVGKVNARQVTARLQQLFADWPKAPEATRMTFPAVAPTAPQRIVIPMPEKSNVELTYGHVGGLTRFSPDYHAAMLSNYILGGDALTGRLGLELRDKLGLTYGVNSGFSAGLGAGPWSTHFTVNPSNVEPALQALNAELRRYLDKGPTRQELDFAKSGFIGSQAVGLATNGGMAGSLSSIELYHLGLDYWSRYPGLIRAVTVQQAHAVARRLIHPENAHTVIVGPVNPEEKPQ
jgi:zinc protease